MSVNAESWALRTRPDEPRERRVRRAYRAYVSVMDSLGWASFYMIVFGAAYHFWGFL
jgi:hypothetical protein